MAIKIRQQRPREPGVNSVAGKWSDKKKEGRKMSFCSLCHAFKHKSQFQKVRAARRQRGRFRQRPKKKKSYTAIKSNKKKKMEQQRTNELQSLSKQRAAIVQAGKQVRSSDAVLGKQWSGGQGATRRRLTNESNKSRTSELPSSTSSPCQHISPSDGMSPPESLGTPIYGHSHELGESQFMPHREKNKPRGKKRDKARQS